MFHGVYDIIRSKEFTVIAVAIDKKKYVNETVLGERLGEIHRLLRGIVDHIRGSTYFSILGNTNIRQ